MTSSSSWPAALKLLIFVSTICLQHAFLLPFPTPCISSTNVIEVAETTALSAKQRRRRRNDEPESSPQNNDLPDFDLESMDAEGVEPQEKPLAPKISLADLEKVTDNMMGDPNKPVRSLKELISDRSLESILDLDDMQGDASIPDFTQLAKASSSSTNLGLDNGIPAPMGKKKQRQVERRASAKETAEEESRDSNPLSNIGFIKNEKGKISPIKILEAGAWLGIFLLIGWELYLNSPFFERAAPMAPVVYELLLREISF
jgi:hypothetical protein